MIDVVHYLRVLVLNASFLFGFKFTRLLILEGSDPLFPNIRATEEHTALMHSYGLDHL